MERETGFWMKLAAGLLVILAFLWWKVFTITGVLWWDFSIPEEERLPAYRNESFTKPAVPDADTVPPDRDLSNESGLRDQEESVER